MNIIHKNTLLAVAQQKTKMNNDQQTPRNAYYIGFLFDVSMQRFRPSYKDKTVSGLISLKSNETDLNRHQQSLMINFKGAITEEGAMG